MEYAKDEVFQIHYSTKLNRVPIKGESWTSKMLRIIKKHKLMATIVIAFITFSTINMLMIYNFMNLLQNI